MRMLVLVLLCLAAPAFAKDDLDMRASDRDELVLKRSYSKRASFELRLDGGTVMNQAFVETYLARAWVGRYFSETFGLGLSYAAAFNRDKDTRACVESFYNDPKKELSVQCESQDPEGEIDTAQEANIGPAYPAIRELNNLITADAVWSPIYGKQIMLQSAVVHFDLQLMAGVGIAQSTYYPTQMHLRGQPDHPSRGTFPESGEAGQRPGTTKADGDSVGRYYGKDGRPDPERQTNPVVTMAMAERFLFFKRFDVSMELRDYVLLGPPSGWENFLALYVGSGVRF